jgi:hypothetical protein
LLVEAPQVQVELVDLVEPQKVVEQVLQPRALAADHFDLGQGPAIARRLRIGKILAQRSMFIRMTDSGFLISCASEPAKAASSL